MTQAERFVRRNRVDERNAAAIGALAGIAAVFSGAQPTGSTFVDWLLVALSVGAVVWASASAPWWAPAGAAGIAAVVALQPVLTVIGAVAFVVGLVIGVRRRDQAELRAVVAAVAMNVFIRSELDGFFGLSAIVGVTIGVALFVVGVRRRPSAIRRVGWIASAAVAGVAVLALLAAGLSALSARSDLTRGNQQARQAIDALDDGSYQDAAALFGDASNAFANADRRLGGPLGWIALLVPGVAQNVRAGADLSAAASVATSNIAPALRQVDPQSWRVVDGAIDIEAIRAVEQPLADVQASLTSLRQVTDDVQSPWLLGRVQTELDELSEEFDANEPRLANAVDAVRLAPQLLGADGQRRYLILFTTPVELRGIAGFIGNYADITVDDGNIEVTEFGRRSDLGAYLAENPGNCDACPPEMLDRYGSFGLTNGPDGGVLPNVWQNLPMPAHFPYTAEAAQVLYPQSGGEPIDGVIALDPYVVAALMEYTGPIEVPELGVTVTPDNAAEFILRDQYLLADVGDGGLDNESRIDALETLGQGVVEALLTGALPEPSELAGDLGPLVAEHRLMVWTDDPDEQQLLDNVGMLGALPELGPDGGFSVIVANGGQSKIDAFLERTTDVRIETAADGSRELVADVTLRNGAPASGLPRYVIGNGYGLPDGSSRLIVNFFGPDTLTSLTIDGQVLSNVAKPEAGWTGYRTDVVLAAGESAAYEARFGLDPVEPGESSGEPVEWIQPLAIPSR
jgi:hypothetical protein